MSEVFLGSPSESTREWCKRHYYAQMPMTIEALEDNTDIRIVRHSSAANTGSFKVSLDGIDWKTIDWSDDIGYGVDNAEVNIVNIAFGREHL